ncbi:MAG: YebC/PmpR family DNA-binding transcriptional regulator [Planctomycetes bacterium]|nr:YebC/PmpR family DNA-binding transcriptional regulator [Planctomycetota bacterium]
MAGHSKWANIKHRKGRQDARRSKMWSKCARFIIVAARNGGGDPATNLSLRYAIDEAKAQNMPKDTIANAIKKGTGELGGENYEPVIYEGYGPGGVAMMVECLTNNRNRTAGDIRTAFDKAGGNLGTTNSVAYTFTQTGVFAVAKDAIGEEAIMELALEAGAEDVTDEGEVWQITCPPTNFHAVRTALEDAKLETQVAELSMIPSTTVECTGDIARKVMNLVDTLEDLDDVQKVHANFEIPDEDLAALG